MINAILFKTKGSGHSAAEEGGGAGQGARRPQDLHVRQG